VTSETQADEVEAEVIIEPLTDEEIWGEPDTHADDPDEDKEVEGVEG